LLDLRPQQFFLKATQLDQIHEDIDTVTENIAIIQRCLEQKEGVRMPPLAATATGRVPHRS